MKYRRHLSIRLKKSGASSVWGKVLVGGLLLLLAFGLLWSNEGRTNLAGVAQQSVPAAAEEGAPNLERAFVSVTGRLASDGILGDDAFLRAGDYVALERFVEMYAWVEKVSGDAQDNKPDSRYQLEWTADPQPPDEFEAPAGHENPPLPVQNLSLTAKTAVIGAYQIEPGQIQLPRLTPLTLTPQNVVEGPYQIADNAIFIGQGSPTAPQLGDVRISYWVVQENILVTAFGRNENGRIQPYAARGKTELYRVLAGDRETAVAQLNAEYKNLLWGFRLAGLCAMWLGILLVISPLTTLLARVPVLGRFGGRTVAILAFAAAFILAASVSLISAVLHNAWLALLILALLLGGGFYWSRKSKLVENLRG